MKKIWLLVTMCWCLALTGYGATRYVDRTRPDNSGDGLSWATAKRTIQAAVDGAAISDTVLVGPGIYDEGMTVTPGGYLSNRVVVTKSIFLESSDGAATTVIAGARDANGDANGLGTNAIRCVYMTTGTLKGFTLTGGATSSNTAQGINERGGGLYSTSQTAPLVYDCIISNNASHRGGGAYQGTFHRSLFAGNVADLNSSAIRESRAYDCLIVSNTGPSAIGYQSSSEGIVNCTIARNSGIALDNSSAYNCIITENTGNVANSGKLVANCCISSTAGVSSGSNNIVNNDARFIDSANGDFRLLTGSPCLDTANPAFVGTAGPAASRTDYSGNARLQGAALDIGAIEGSVPGVAIVMSSAQGAGAGSIAPLGRFVLETLPTQLVFTATADAGSALRHFTRNGGKLKDSGDTYTMTVTQPGDYTVAAVFYPARYVDAVNGDDANDGTATNTAWRTLQYAATTAAAGTLVLAAPGVYSEGHSYNADHSNRVSITSNIVLKGSEGAEQTVIAGARDLLTGNAFGCGPAAIRCVYMNNGTIEGFTLAGGATSFSVNDADFDYVRGGGIYAGGSPEVWDCIISNNVASRGSCTWGGQLHRCLITENLTSNPGNGAIRSASVYDSLIVRNVSKWAAAFGGARLYNCTVTENTGGGISSLVQAYNTIIYNNSDTEVENSSAICTNCCTGENLRPGEGNIFADPLFVDAPNGDYSLQVLSPCINSGNSAYGTGATGTDYAGARRVYGVQVDMGAYEDNSGGVRIYASVVGGGSITPSGTLHWESTPMSQTFTATPWLGRELLYFSTNDVPVPNTGNTIEIARTTDVTVTLVATFSQATFYADASRPDDSGDGVSWATAKRTLQAAVDLTIDGDTVIVAPGSYSEGTRATPGGYLLNRVTVTNDITITSTGGAESTIIRGAFDVGSGDTYGRGPNAVRCVYLGKGKLQGFTLTGGATDNVNLENQNNRGGGVYVPEFQYSQLVLDCVISNNASVRGGGAHSGTLRRCALLDNYAQNNSSGARSSYAYDSLFARNRTGGNTAGSAVGYGWCYSCTITDNEGRAGDNVDFYNSIVDGKSVSGKHFDCCVTGEISGTGTTNDNSFTDAPLFVNSAAGDYRLTAGSPCLDRANRAYVADAFGTDLDGAPRMTNARVDLGAYERDWRSTYVADLDGTGISVTEATPFVTHVTNSAYFGGSAVYLDGAAALADQQTTVELMTSWQIPYGRTVMLGYEVTGNGTLVLFEDATPIATATSADGPVTLKYTALQNPCLLSFVYTPATGDTGGALLDDFEGSDGLLILLR